MKPKKRYPKKWNSQKFNSDRKDLNSGLKAKQDTSWQGVSEWYDKSVGVKGQYFHQNIILPKSIQLLGLNESKVKDNSLSLLDLGCGQGVFSRSISKDIAYQGLDLSPSLVAQARQSNHNKNHTFNIADITKPLPITKKDFTHAAIILALQNVENMESVIKNAAIHLEQNGLFLIVLNHPIFRIPRQSEWGIDEKNKIQYRRINRYLSPLKIPINMTPGGKTSQSKFTWSFHHSLQDYSIALHKAGFCITRIEEWVSDKKSEGSAAKMENFARKEIPMFMAILSKKQA